MEAHLIIGKRAKMAIKRRSRENDINFPEQCERDGLEYASAICWGRKCDPSVYYLGIMAKAGYDIYWILTGERKEA